MLVDPKSHAMVTNFASDEGGKVRGPGLFVSSLPAQQAPSNTSVQWDGRFYAEVMWPLGDDDAVHQTKLLLHESLHRMQAEKNWPTKTDLGANGHLDSLEGRYLLQLEWRALGRALTSEGEGRRRAIQDALVFRKARRNTFSNAARDEQELEQLEGLAEYTGVKLASPDPKVELQLALENLTGYPQRPSFVRSFAYASGPAYGLLLDDTGAAWREEAKLGKDLGDLLASAAHLSVPSAKAISSLAGRYDGGHLRAAEVARDAENRLRVAAFRQALVQGPVLRLALVHNRISYDPRTLVSLEGTGMVYPTAHIDDDWGVLTVEQGGVLVDPAFRSASVRGPRIHPCIRPACIREGGDPTRSRKPGIWVAAHSPAADPRGAGAEQDHKRGGPASHGSSISAPDPDRTSIRPKHLKHRVFLKSSKPRREVLTWSRFSS
jgi:hypothetical protein